MPLDSHGYLVAQGWQGKGTALREGALVRPIAVIQKKNLAGVGKDRDEAFPFWDHLFSAAASAIKLKVGSDDESGSEESGGSSLKLERTRTGIISNRRPTSGTPADTSRTSTPDTDIPQLSLIATAKREAARRGLYSCFFRGPTLGPDPESHVQEIVEAISTVVVATAVTKNDATVTIHKDAKHKSKDKEDSTAFEDSGKDKRRRRGEKRANEGKEEERKRSKKRNKEIGITEMIAGPSSSATPETILSRASVRKEKEIPRKSKEERRQLKEERRVRRAERRARREARDNDVATTGNHAATTVKENSDPSPVPILQSNQAGSMEDVSTATTGPSIGLTEGQFTKKKRKRKDNP